MTRQYTDQQKEKRNLYERERKRRIKLGLPTRTTPKSVTTNNPPSGVYVEIPGKCVACHQKEMIYKGRCRWCRNFGNVPANNAKRSAAGKVGAGRSPWAHKGKQS